MIVTAKRIPVPIYKCLLIIKPEPIAPNKSAMIVKRPINIPPLAAAIGIVFSNYSIILVSLCPAIVID